MNSPDRAVCVSAAASWIKKEEYSTANAFFEMDVANSYVDPGGYIDKTLTDAQSSVGIQHGYLCFLAPSYD